MAIPFDKLEKALELAASGVLPGELCKRLKLTWNEFSWYRTTNPDYEALFRAARLRGAEMLAESTIKTAKKEPPSVAREINAAKWTYLAKLFPREYGEQVEVKVTNAPSLSDAIAEGIARTVTQVLPNSRKLAGVVDLKRIPASSSLDGSSVATFAPVHSDDDEDPIP